jgi:hypothetical protein
MRSASRSPAADFDPFSLASHAAYLHDAFHGIFYSIAKLVLYILCAPLLLLALPIRFLARTLCVKLVYTPLDSGVALKFFPPPSLVRLSTAVASLLKLEQFPPAIHTPQVAPPTVIPRHASSTSTHRPALVGVVTAMFLAFMLWSLVTWMPTASVTDNHQNFPHTSDPPDATTATAVHTPIVPPPASSPTSSSSSSSTSNSDYFMTCFSSEVRSSILALCLFPPLPPLSLQTSLQAQFLQHFSPGEPDGWYCPQELADDGETLCTYDSVDFLTAGQPALKPCDPELLPW